MRIDASDIVLADRSGRTPVEVLGGTRGTLLVDAYTGYNKVTVIAAQQDSDAIR